MKNTILKSILVLLSTVSSLSYAENYNNVLVLQPGQSMYMSSPQLVVCSMQQIIQDQVFIRNVRSGQVSGNRYDDGKCSEYDNGDTAANVAATTALSSVRAECEATSGRECDAFVVTSTPYHGAWGETFCDIQVKAIAKK